MAGRENGREPGILRLPSLTPKRRTLVIGEQEYEAFVWGERVPGTVEAEVNDAFNEANAKYTVPGPDDTRIISNNAGYRECVNRALMALVPGLSFGDADLLSMAECRQILRYLEYMAGEEEEPGNAERAETEETTSTTETPSPESVPSTA